MAGYYWKFCRDFATLCRTLSNIYRKDVAFVWSDACQRAFDKVTAIDLSTCVNFGKLFILTTDASDCGIGAVFLQEDTKGIGHPIGYYTHKSSASQKNYSKSELWVQ